MAIFNETVTTLLILLTSVALLLAYYLKLRYSYWSQRKIPFVPQDVRLNRSLHDGYKYRDIHRELSPNPFGGFYSYSKPALLIRDPALIQQILIKDFNHFTDRGTGTDEKLDPLTAHLFNAQGDVWRNLRLKIIPAFSSGKLRRMYGLLEECVSEMDRCIESRIATNNIFEMKELFSKFALDVIGTCAFGIKCNALADDSSEFRQITRVLFRPSIRHTFIGIFNAIDTRLNRYIGLKRHQREIEDFFRDAIQKAIEYKESGTGKRTDFLQHMINTRQEETKKTSNTDSENVLTDDALAANSFVFFAAGFETISLTLSYSLLELALNPDIQDKVRAEMEAVKSTHGSFTYDAIKELNYTSMVISETLRKYPVLPWLERVCVQQYTIPGSSTVVQPGVKIYISTLALHHDPEYFPNPDKFDPERFNDENKQTIKPGTYFPFGNGPRICIGMRFAQLEIKSALADIISKYDIKLSERTQLPVQAMPGALMLVPRGGIHLKFIKRT